MDNKVALFVARFIKVLFGVDLEHIVTHLETDWLHFRGDVLAALFHVAECLV